MKTILTAIAASLLLLAGCDRGTAPQCASGDTTCVDIGGATGSAGSLANGGTGSTGSTGNQGNNGNSGSNDTSSPGQSGSSSGGLVANTGLVFDSGLAIVTLKKVDLAGRPTVQGGDKRQIAFFLEQDNSLHIVGSSDGEVQTTFNRETIYDVYVLSNDSIAATWLTTTDGGLGRSTWIRTRDASDPGNILWALSFRFYTNARPLEAKIDVKSGATLLVRVKARSGVVSNTVLEDSLPQLKIPETKTLMKFGPNLTAVGSDPFLVVMP
ncbi:MAG: hypothetical protein AAB214_00760 [Fibrobacterota bacterium]